MIKLEGSIIIRTKRGKRGDFSVGELITEIGTFKVKEAILDQYPEGRYDGTFLVSKIYSTCYAWSGGVVAEIRAKVETIYLAQSREGVPEQEPMIDPDPIDEDAQPKQALAPAPVTDQTLGPLDADSSGGREKGEPPIQAPPELPTEDADASLFGDLASDVASGFPVRLDPTIDRGQFRAQRDRLKALGYSFDATHQTWQIRTA